MRVIGTRLSRKEAEERLFKVEMTQQLDRLTAEEKTMITEMSIGLSQRINNSIYNSNIKPELKDKLDIVDKALAKGKTTRDITVTRVTDVRFLDVYKGEKKWITSLF